MDKHLSCEWALLKRFSRSDVKGQGHIARHTIRRCGVEGELLLVKTDMYRVGQKVCCCRLLRVV